MSESAAALTIATQEPWDRIGDESDQAYGAFRTFLLDPQRNFSSVARTVGKNRGLIARWGSRYHWRDRADAWDASIRRQAQERSADALANSMIRLHEATGAISDIVRIESARILREVSAGRMALTIDELSRLYKIAVDCSRLQSGMSTANHAHAHQIDPQTLAPGELRFLANLLEKGDENESQ